MAKPNYSYEKRQRELAKKQKKEEKLKEKAARKTGPQTGEGAVPPDDEAVEGGTETGSEGSGA